MKTPATIWLPLLLLLGVSSGAEVLESLGFHSDFGRGAMTHVTALAELGPRVAGTMSVCAVKKHGSRLIAVSGHHDCAGNPCNETVQRQQIRDSIAHLKSEFPQIMIIGLWVDENWEVDGV